MRTKAELLLFIHYGLYKTTLDYPQILQMLKGRGLIIQDETYALEQLKVMSYFRLAIYLRSMEQDKATHTF